MSKAPGEETEHLRRRRTRLVSAGLLLLVLGAGVTAPAVAQREVFVAGTAVDDTELLPTKEIVGMRYLGAPHVWVTFYTGPGNRNGIGMEGTSVRSLYLSVVNGAKDPAKVRVQVFDDAGQLLSEGDLAVDPGHASELIDSLAYYLNPAHLIEQIPPRVTIVVSSDKPVALFAHEQDFNHASQKKILPPGPYASQHASGSKRHMPFERIDCPAVGREWFCRAPTLATAWDVWHWGEW
jgi:hypothetical protein